MTRTNQQLLLICAALMAALGSAQTQINPGFNCLDQCSVSTNGDDCFVLTGDENTQVGVVWSDIPLDVSQSFSIDASLYFGINDGSNPDPGADGIAFVLQNEGATVSGTQGGGMGFSGISPSFGVEFDTYMNPNTTDIVADHVAFIQDGRLENGIIAGPIGLSENLENGIFHVTKFVWNSSEAIFSVEVNGNSILSAQVSLIGILGSNMAYLGFTSSTGGSKNRHEVCFDSITGTSFLFPSASPSITPTLSVQPSISPSTQPSVKASAGPSARPSTKPSAAPSARPSTKPSAAPSANPSIKPSAAPSANPSIKASAGPSARPSTKPSAAPSANPSTKPSAAPSANPSIKASAGPSAQPSTKPSAGPSAQPSTKASAGPSEIPSIRPSVAPSTDAILSPFASDLLLDGAGNFSNFSCLADCTVRNIGSRCFQLTPDDVRQTGVVWSEIPLDISRSFIVEASLYFGINDGSNADPGADGIVFVLQNEGPQTLGTKGGGLGFSGINPSLGVEFDTFNNPNSTDVEADHVALVEQGNLVDGVVVGPEPLSFNLEDGIFHKMKVEWDSSNQTLTVVLDDVVVLSPMLSIIDILGSTFAYLGFTASTGASTNRHEVCFDSIIGDVFDDWPTASPSDQPGDSNIPSSSQSVSYNPTVFSSKRAIGVSSFNCLDNCTRLEMDSSSCFELTADDTRQSGRVWYQIPMDLSQSLTVAASLYFGVNDGTSPDPGADGIAFVLQNEGPLTVGNQGGGMGFSGIQPSLGVEFDTYLNPNTNDLVDDHVALVENGKQIDGVVAGPFSLPINLEDGVFHSMTFQWDSDNLMIDVLLDGISVLSTKANIVDILGTNFAYIGFTASTGMSTNRHEVCIESIDGSEFMNPSVTPSLQPSLSPKPSVTPSLQPSLSPKPSVTPSLPPSLSPKPSVTPSLQPSLSKTPSVVPSQVLSQFPSFPLSQSPSVGKGKGKGGGKSVSGMMSQKGSGSMTQLKKPAGKGSPSPSLSLSTTPSKAGVNRGEQPSTSPSPSKARDIFE